MTKDKYISSQTWYRIGAVEKSRERLFSSVIDVNETEVAGWMDDLRHKPYVNFVEQDKTAGAERLWATVEKQDIDKYMAGRTTFTIKCEFTDGEYLPIARSVQLTGTFGQPVSLYDEAVQRIEKRKQSVALTAIVAGILVVAGLAFGVKSFRSRPGGLLPR
jgi:hypothetical protein